MAEHGLLECWEPKRINVFDHLDEGCGVEARQPTVTVGQCGLQQGQTLALALGHALDVQSVAGDLQRLKRDVGADDLRHTWNAQKQRQQATLAAAEVQHGSRT